MMNRFLQSPSTARWPWASPSLPRKPLLPELIAQKWVRLLPLQPPPLKITVFFLKTSMMAQPGTALYQFLSWGQILPHGGRESDRTRFKS